MDLFWLDLLVWGLFWVLLICEKRKKVFFQHFGFSDTCETLDFVCEFILAEEKSS